MEYVYTVWFRNASAEPDDQDREWPASLVVDAPTMEDAVAWGDHLAKRFSGRHPEELFLKSRVDPVESNGNTDLSSTPHIKFGHEATDAEIGW